MANYDAIGTVSEAIIETLRSQIHDRENVISLNRNDISLTSPDDVGSDSDTRLSVYLYKVERNKQQQPQTITEDNVRKGSPLSLELHYLMTAYPSTAGADETTNNRDQHSVLGLAMQVLHDNSGLDTERLGASFRDDPTPNIRMDTESETTVSRIWDSFRDVPLYPSVTYTVSPVLLDSRRKEEIQRVSEREANIDRKEPPERGNSR
jgi:hypothetical protein